MYKIGFIGGGKMAEAMIRSLLANKVADREGIICSDVLQDRRQALSRQFGIRLTESNLQVCRESEIIVLAFKPQGFPEVVKPLAQAVRADHIIISILAGIRIGAIRKYLPGRVIRVMPNTCCLVGEMAAGYTPAENVEPEDLRLVKAILESAGLAIEVREDELDAVTALSGSGPAFVAYLIESFIQAGVAAGLSVSVARQLTLKTFAGTARLLNETQMSAEDLIAMVSSPQGTTVAGREILESSGMAETIEKTVKRAQQRSRELGQ